MSHPLQLQMTDLLRIAGIARRIVRPLDRNQHADLAAKYRGSASSVVVTNAQLRDLIDALGRLDGLTVGGQQEDGE